MATPTVSDPSPLPGDFATDREADRRTVVSFTHVRANASSSPVIWARIGAQFFLVYDGTGFVPLFAGGSSLDQDDDDYVFSVIPAGGWWGEVKFYGCDGFLWTGQIGVGDEGYEEQ